MDLGKLEAKSAATLETLSLLRAEDRTYWTKKRFLEEGLPIHPELIVLDDYVMGPEQYAKVQRYLVTAVEEFHQANPAPGPNRKPCERERPSHQTL